MSLPRGPADDKSTPTDRFRNGRIAQVKAETAAIAAPKDLATQAALDAADLAVKQADAAYTASRTAIDQAMAPYDIAYKQSQTAQTTGEETRAQGRFPGELAQQGATLAGTQATTTIAVRTIMI